MKRMHRVVYNPLKVGVVLLLTVCSLRGVASAQTCVVAPSGLLSWWSGDGHANDLQNGNHGTLHGGATFATGKVGPAFSFDGVDDFVEMPENGSLDLSGDFTIEAWINPQQLNTSTPVSAPPVVSKYDFSGALQANTSYAVFLRTDGSLVFGVLCEHDMGATTPGSVIGIGDFTHVAAVYRRTPVPSMEVYVNGALQPVITTQGSCGSINQNDIPFRIGMRGDAASTDFLNGQVDEVSVYNRALSAAEILAIYDAGAAGKCKDEDGDGFRPPDDCDEADASINPAATELPGNFVDEDCNGDLGDCNPCLAWKNHGDYVRCVAHAVEALVSGGSISQEDGDALVASAAASSIGKKGFLPPQCQ